MSFTSIVKNEASKLQQIKSEKISELSAIMQNAILSEESIKITTENASVARLIFTLLKEIYQIQIKITVRKGYNYNKNYIYIRKQPSSKRNINGSRNLRSKYNTRSTKKLYIR